MINVKNNFRGSHQINPNCPLGCPNEIDSQLHLIQCQNSLNSPKVSETEYNAIFGFDEEIMIPVIKKLDQILDERRQKLD